MTRTAPITPTLKDFALELAEQARAVLRQLGTQELDVANKPDHSLVTQLDRAIEAQLRRTIEHRYPNHGIIGEEYGHKPVQPAGDDLCWVLDPIDGTHAFVAGAPTYGTLIALAHQDVPVLGVIDIPEINARWLGVQGQPTTRNGQPCRTRACTQLAQAIMSNGTPDFYTPRERPAFDHLRRTTRSRLYGTSCLAYGLLASGRTDLAIDTKQQVYDFAPFRPIIEGAGGCVTDWQGQPLTLHSSGQLLAAGDARLHAQALQIIHTLS